MIETYGQRYRIYWAAFRQGRMIDSGELTVRPTKPALFRDVVVKIRSQALNAADKWLRKNKSNYARGDAWALTIEPVKENE
jgi:hypothetical protein